MIKSKSEKLKEVLGEPERFWNHIDKCGLCPREELDNCWIWTGKTNRDGYGIMYRDLGRGENNKRIRTHFFAHHISHYLSGGEPIGPNQIIMHHCDNPPCVRPSHLELATNLKNRLDSIAKRRHNYGERHGLSKLSDEAVADILKEVADNPNWNSNALASKYSVSRACIWFVVKGDTWKHINRD